jgi:hypothetical protein
MGLTPSEDKAETFPNRVSFYLDFLDETRKIRTIIANQDIPPKLLFFALAVSLLHPRLRSSPRFRPESPPPASCDFPAEVCG